MCCSCSYFKCDHYIVAAFSWGFEERYPLCRSSSFCFCCLNLTPTKMYSSVKITCWADTWASYFAGRSHLFPTNTIGGIVEACVAFLDCKRRSRNRNASARDFRESMLYTKKKPSPSRNHWSCLKGWKPSVKKTMSLIDEHLRARKES